MLDAHPKISNPGEFDFLFDHLHVDQLDPSKWIYDKKALHLDRILLEQNFEANYDLYDGLELLFFMIKELRKTTVKPIFSINVHRNLDKIRTMYTGQFMDLKYEIVMNEPEIELRKVCDFLGCSYAQEMMHYHKNTTYGPPDKSFAYQWREKMSSDEAVLVERKAGALMSERGYEVFGGPTLKA
ncbi:MAG: sulfotransferase domain-containing protein [Hyphomicrobiales bacterium]